jgi:hypothetical protein
MCGRRYIPVSCEKGVGITVWGPPALSPLVRLDYVWYISQCLAANTRQLPFSSCMLAGNFYLLRLIFIYSHTRYLWYRENFPYKNCLPFTMQKLRGIFYIFLLLFHVTSNACMVIDIVQTSPDLIQTSSCSDTSLLRTSL